MCGVYVYAESAYCPLLAELEAVLYDADHVRFYSCHSYIECLPTISFPCLPHPCLQYFREERGEVAGHLYRSSLFKEAGSVCVSPSASPPAVQLEMLLVAGGANVSYTL